MAAAVQRAQTVLAETLQVQQAALLELMVEQAVTAELVQAIMALQVPLQAEAEVEAESMHSKVQAQQVACG